MAREAEERQRQRALIDQEIEAEKQMRKAKKLQLKELQDRDILLKKEVHQKREAVYNNDDFKDKHIMSYCFDPKENRAQILGRRNEKIVGILGNQFTG
jgi:23S rRNA A2030 N6-methylase RlmJ